MAQDIDRHLQSLPILARPAGVGYRLRKLWARQKLAMTAATAVGLSLLIGLGVAYWQALERDRQFHLAQQRLQQAETALDFVTQVVTESLQAGETVSRDAFVQRSEALLQGASLTVPTERLLVANTIAVWAASFGQYERADALLTRVLDGLPVDLDPTLAATVRCNRAVMRASQGQEEGAPAELDAMIALLDAKGGDSDWECRYKRAQLRRNGNDAAGALADIEQALRSFEAAGYRSAHSRAILVAEHGYALSLNGRIAQAEERYAAAVDMLRRAGRQDSAFAGTVHNNWGNALIAAGQPRAAIAQFDRALEIGRLVAPLGAPPASRNNRAQALRGAGAWRDALQAYQAGLQVAREQHAQPSEFFALVGMAATADALAQGDDARRYLAEARQVAERLQLPAGSPTALGLRITEAVLLKSEGQLTEADQRLARITEEVASLGLKGNIPSALRILRAEIALGQAHAPEAGALASEALDLARAAQGGFAPRCSPGNGWCWRSPSRRRPGWRRGEFRAATVTQLEASAVDPRCRRPAGLQ
jgi:tetratricopeptide (TPR) repeat protein